MKILLFGVTQEIVGNRMLTLSETLQSEIRTVGELKSYLKKTFPGFVSLTSIAVAVNMEYAQDDTEIRKEDEVAIIPPVSGG
ncbi:MAG: hypothetical protein RLZZ241_648 [Bacteroidota bacterium]|jgi:molybdopterin synthase sulfur carrier subunit